MTPDTATSRLAVCGGISVLFFTTLYYFPAALTSSALNASGLPSAQVSLGFGVAAFTAVASLAIVSTTKLQDLAINRSVSAGTLGFGILAAWMIFQSIMRPDSSEIFRSIGSASLLISGHLTGRFLGAVGRAPEFFSKLAPWFLASYCIGLAVSVVNPEAVRWGHGILGSSSPRSWFFFLLVPQPLFALISFEYRRRYSTHRRANLVWGGASVTLLLLAIATATRTYILTLAGIIVLVWMARRWMRVFPTVLVGIAGILLVPGVLDKFLVATRLSSFVTGVDPVSGRADVTNGRGQLADVLLGIINQNPVAGIGASAVRQAISGLAATSETGLLMGIASYGALAGIVLGLYVLVAFVKSWRGLLVSSDLGLLCAGGVVICIFSTTVFFGLTTSFSDWLALVLVSSVLRSSFDKDVVQSVTVDRVTTGDGAVRPRSISRTG